MRIELFPSVNQEQSKIGRLAWNNTDLGRRALYARVRLVVWKDWKAEISGLQFTQEGSYRQYTSLWIKEKRSIALMEPVSFLKWLLDNGLKSVSGCLGCSACFRFPLLFHESEMNSDCGAYNFSNRSSKKRREVKAIWCCPLVVFVNDNRALRFWGMDFLDRFENGESQSFGVQFIIFRHYVFLVSFDVQKLWMVGAYGGGKRETSLRYLPTILRTGFACIRRPRYVCRLLPSFFAPHSS